MSRRTRWIAAAVAVTLLACALAWWLAAEDGEEQQPTLMAEPPPGALEVVPAPSIEEAGECAGGARRPFIPESVTIEGVVADAAVVGVPRDARGVTGVLPISNKVEVAWDLGGVRPGSRRGNVLLNTHTWEDGSALGNALLDELDLGDRLMVKGGGSYLCYEVDMRIEVPVEEGYRPYYEEDGPPRVAIVVCSGERRPNGVWSHRTIWFARALSRA